MPWSSKARNQAIIIVVFLVPILIFGLGVAAFYVSKFIGLGNNSVYAALTGATAGLAISIFLTLRVGRQYEATDGDKKTPS